MYILYICIHTHAQIYMTPPYVTSSHKFDREKISGEDLRVMSHVQLSHVTARSTEAGFAVVMKKIQNCNFATTVQR